ncbi:PB1-F2 protein [Influenza A virus]
MEQGLGTPWTQSTEHTNTQRKGSGRQIQKLGLPSSTQLMDHYLRIMNQVDMHKQIVSWRLWPFLKNPTQASLKTLALKQWKPFNRQG